MGGLDIEVHGAGGAGTEVHGPTDAAYAGPTRQRGSTINDKSLGSRRRTLKRRRVSKQKRAQALAAKYPLEELEEMAVAAKGKSRRADLELAIRIGREARGGSSDSGGAVLDMDQERAEAPAQSARGRVVLDAAVLEGLDSGSTDRPATPDDGESEGWLARLKA